MYPLYGVELEAFAQHGLRVRGEPARGVKKCHSDGGKVSERACQTRWCSLKVLLLLNSLYTRLLQLLAAASLLTVPMNH